MKFSTFLFYLVLITASCKNGQISKHSTYNDFVFSTSTESDNYSLKFTDSDTIFFEKRFPKPKQLYYAIIQNNDKEKLDSILQKTDFTKYDTVYFQNNLQDGISYKFYLTKKAHVNWVLMYGHTGPKSLYDFADWLTNLKDRQTFHPINGTVDFGNLIYIILPPIPPPTNNRH